MRNVERCHLLVSFFDLFVPGVLNDVIERKGKSSLLNLEGSGWGDVPARYSLSEIYRRDLSSVRRGFGFIR